MEGSSDTARPRVSVVIAALDDAPNLSRLLSMLPDEVGELVLLDGESADAIADLAGSIRPGVRIVRAPVNRARDPLAAAVAACSGEIILMLEPGGSAESRDMTGFVDALVRGAESAKRPRPIAARDRSPQRGSRSPAVSAAYG